MNRPSERGFLSRFGQRLATFARWILEPDQLATTTEQPPRRSPTTIVMHWLTGHDALPSIAEPTRPGDRILLWLFSVENLPFQKATIEPRTRSFVGWVFTPERLTLTRSTESAKEVSNNEP